MAAPRLHKSGGVWRQLPVTAVPSPDDVYEATLAVLGDPEHRGYVRLLAAVFDARRAAAEARARALDVAYHQRRRKRLAAQA